MNKRFENIEINQHNEILWCREESFYLISTRCKNTIELKIDVVAVKGKERKKELKTNLFSESVAVFLLSQEHDATVAAFHLLIETSMSRSNKKYKYCNVREEICLFVSLAISFIVLSFFFIFWDAEHQTPTLCWYEREKESCLEMK